MSARRPPTGPRRRSRRPGGSAHDATPSASVARAARPPAGQVEEYETALEELKSANEELVSVNEELQSTNEELETSKEELQSVNEELQTVNAELRTRSTQLDRANSDLQNLFESTQIATVFLDRELRDPQLHARRWPRCSA